MSAVAACASAVTKLFFNISKNIRASKFKIYRNVVLHRPYTVTGNDVISYFRSATNSVNAARATVNFRVWK